MYIIYNMKILLIAFVVISVTLAEAPTFPNQYELGFTEKASIGPISGSTTGKIYYDYTNNRQIITRANGHYDRYCGSVFKLTNTPCNHIIEDSKI